VSPSPELRQTSPTRSAKQCIRSAVGLGTFSSHYPLAHEIILSSRRSLHITLQANDSRENSRCVQMPAVQI
jgi:hypothetical protein